VIRRWLRDRTVIRRTPQRKAAAYGHQRRSDDSDGQDVSPQEHAWDIAVNRRADESPSRAIRPTSRAEVGPAKANYYYDQLFFAITRG